MESIKYLELAENILHPGTELLTPVLHVLVLLTQQLCPVPHLHPLLLQAGQVGLPPPPGVLEVPHPPLQLLPGDLQPGEVLPPEPAGHPGQELQAEGGAETGGGGGRQERLTGLAREEGGEL